MHLADLSGEASCCLPWGEVLLAWGEVLLAAEVFSMSVAVMVLKLSSIASSYTQGRSMTLAQEWGPLKTNLGCFPSEESVDSRKGFLKCLGINHWWSYENLHGFFPLRPANKISAT